MIDAKAIADEVVKAFDSLPAAADKDPMVAINLYHNLGALIGYFMAVDTLNMLVFNQRLYEKEIGILNSAQLAVLPQTIHCMVKIGMDNMPDEFKTHLNRIANARNN